MRIYSSPSYAGAPRFGRPQQLRPSAIIPSILTRIGSERARPRATRRATRSSSTELSSHPALPPALSSMTSSSRGIFASTSYPSGLRARTKALAIGTSRSTSTAFASPSPVIASGSYTWVTSTDTPSKPAAASDCSYSAFSTAPETHPDHISAVRITSLGRALLSPRKTTSETANLPPGFKTLYASRITLSFSVERLITQLEITTSTHSLGRGISSISPLRNSTFSTPASRWFWRQTQHLVSHVQPVGLSTRGDPLGREQDVYATTTAQVQHNLAGRKGRQGHRVAAP